MPRKARVEFPGAVYHLICRESKTDPICTHGAYTDYSYNAINQVDTQTSYFNGSTARFDYGFDTVNRIKYEQRDSGVADGFSFDPRNELTGFNQNGILNGNGTVSAAYNLSVTYDANGNRIDALDGNTAHYSTAPNNQYSSDWTRGAEGVSL